MSDRVMAGRPRNRPAPLRLVRPGRSGAPADAVDPPARTPATPPANDCALRGAAATVWAPANGGPGVAVDLPEVLAAEMHQLDGQPWGEAGHQEDQRPDDGLGDRLRRRCTGAFDLPVHLAEAIGEHAEPDHEDDDQDELGDHQGDHRLDPLAYPRGRDVRGRAGKGQGGEHRSHDDQQLADHHRAPDEDHRAKNDQGQEQGDGRDSRWR